MTDSSTRFWYPSAAYLYVLHLDSHALAWEYLRRHPDYRRDWQYRNRRPQAAHQAAQRWGLRLLEDPALDAREAHPVWFPDQDSVQLYPDADPLPDAVLFRLWSIPGTKHLVHDGKRLVLWLRWPGGGLRVALAPGLADGMAYVYAMRASARVQVFMLELNKLALADDAIPIAAVRSRPTLSALQELHTLQALDATLAGASLYEVAQGLFGAEVAAGDWHADGALRARVRRLVRRGDTLMRGGYRRLAQLPLPEQGRSSSGAKRP